MTFDHPTFDHPLHWTEDEYLALGETTSLVELVHGGLWVSPSSGTMIHQRALMRLQHALTEAADAADLEMIARVNMRLVPGSILNPDIVAARPRGYDQLLIDAADVTLVGEVTTQHSATTDRWLKPHLYAAARIPWYLLAEPDISDASRGTLHLHRLDGAHYVEHATAGPGHTLVSDAPFPIEIDPDLLFALGRNCVDVRRADQGEVA